jgi:hypothetical protein
VAGLNKEIERLQNIVSGKSELAVLAELRAENERLRSDSSQPIGYSLLIDANKKLNEEKEQLRADLIQCQIELGVRPRGEKDEMETHREPLP